LTGNSAFSIFNPTQSDLSWLETTILAVGNQGEFTPERIQSIVNCLENLSTGKRRTGYFFKVGGAIAPKKIKKGE
jgi:hypothetical protein